MLLCVLWDGRAFAGISQMPGKCGGGLRVRAVGTLVDGVVDEGRWVIGFI